MTITVIIPVLNEAARVGGLVGFLLKNGGPLVEECIVVDGGSQDDTVAHAIAAGARVECCSVASRAAQMNAGARVARGEVLYFVHADTLPPASFAQDIQTALQEGCVMGCYRYRFDSPRIMLRINAYFNRFSWLWCQGGDKTFFIRRKFFQDMGGYDEHYVIMEEYDFLRRAMKQYPLCTLPKYATVSARKYEQNSWLRVQLANTLVFHLFRLGIAPLRLKKLYRDLLH